ncbi:hypothetical protein [Butyrivibrio sp.]|uniref:hypothetical protein n=1 Tax=Butyrivibrio sp. TaxID=28121 RepID=UPI0025BE6E16|nr:hypothetical protein [Butyrivibrio sp.]MBQ9304292.1 hypothetical protein [Butyrivibrio sp.]
MNNMPDEATNEYLEDVISDGRLTEPSDGKKYRLREAILYSEKLGRPLTDEEMALFEVR